ncbi:hypothetical protein Tco_0799957 [Tanacetum coccineum]|uniref:Uncharacterized protein n=1 Tax=Tanacetum coccineum TaxID=301880 RepID=A0ABQ4ZRS9_9ASTR
MALSIADQIALDDALVAPADRLKIGKCNLRLSSDITSKEATLQVVYDVLKLTPFYKAFQVTADAPEIYMQEFWVASRNETTQLYGAILPVTLTNEDIRNSESYKEYYAMASGIIPPKTKGSKKKANTDAIPKLKPPTAPKEKKSGKRKQKTTERENISEADLTEAEQLKIVIKRSRQETHSSHASGSGADEGTGVKPGVPDAPDYDSEDDISWKSTDDDQDDEQDQDDDDAEKHDKAEDDDDEELTESDNDGDDFVHPKLTTHDDEIIHEEDTEEDDSSISSSDEEDNDNDVEGANVASAKSDEDATDEKDQGNEGTIPSLIFWLPPSNGTILTAQVNRPTNTDPIVVQTQTSTIYDTGKLLQAPYYKIFPNFVLVCLALIILKTESTRRQLFLFRQTNQYAEALSSILAPVDQYLGIK